MFYAALTQLLRAACGWLVRSLGLSHLAVWHQPASRPSVSTLGAATPCHVVLGSSVAPSGGAHALMTHRWLYRACTEPVPSLYRACTEPAPSLYLACTELVPSLHRACAEPILSLHQAGTGSLPSLHRAYTEPVPSRYWLSTESAPSLYWTCTDSVKRIFHGRKR